MIFGSLITTKILSPIELRVFSFLSSKLIVRFFREGVINVGFAENSLRLQAIIKREIMWLFARDSIDCLGDTRDLFGCF